MKLHVENFMMSIDMLPYDDDHDDDDVKSRLIELSIFSIPPSLQM